MTTFLGSLMEDVSDGINFFGEAIESAVQEIIDDVDHWAHPDDAPAETGSTAAGAVVPVVDVALHEGRDADAEAGGAVVVRSKAAPGVVGGAVDDDCTPRMVGVAVAAGDVLQGTSTALRGDQQGAEALCPRRRGHDDGAQAATESSIDNTSTECLPSDPHTASTRPCANLRKQEQAHTRKPSVLDDFADSSGAVACTAASAAAPRPIVEGGGGTTAVMGTDQRVAPPLQRLPPPSLFVTDRDDAAQRSPSASQVAFPLPQRHGRQRNHNADVYDADEWELVAPPPMEDIDAVVPSMSAVAEDGGDDGKSPFQLV